MQRIVGGVEVEDDLLGDCRVSVEEKVHEQVFDGHGVGGDPGAACGLDLAQFQAVECTLAGLPAHSRSGRR
jgi:hypothetical protein